MDKLEKILKLVKDKENIEVEKIEGWNSLDEMDKKQIRKEWSIYNSVPYRTVLAVDYLKKYGENKIEVDSISSKLDISLTSAELIKQTCILIQNDKIKPFTKKEKSNHYLYWLTNKTICEQQLEEERIKLIKGELDGICKYGSSYKILLFYKIAELLKNKKYVYYFRGTILSSLLAYHLGIHNIDCYKFGIDYHLCHGASFDKDYSIDLAVSYKHKDVVTKLITKNIFKNKKYYRVWFEKDNFKDKLIIPYKIIYPLKPIDETLIIEVKDYTGIKYECLSQEYVHKNSNNFIIINVLSNVTLDFLENMNNLYPIENIDIYDVKYINRNLHKNLKHYLNGEEYDILRNIDHELSFNEYIEWLGYIRNTRKEETELFSNLNITSRDDALVILTNIIGYEGAIKAVNNIIFNKEIKKYDLSKCDNNTRFALLNSNYLFIRASLIQTLFIKVIEGFYFDKYEKEACEYYKNIK